MEDRAKELKRTSLHVGVIYKISTINGENSFITYLGGDDIMLPDGSFSYLIESDKLYHFPLVELFLSINVN